MKHTLISCTRIAVFISLVLFVAACSGDREDLKVGDWGPQSMVLGDIPNKQPDGNLGIWIQVTGEKGLGELKVLFDGEPQITAVHEKLITAGVSPKLLMQEGNKEVVIKQVSTGKTFSVGTFVIKPLK